MAIYLGTNKVNFSTGDITTLLNLQTKTVSPTTSLQTITADSGYHALSTVKVNAMPTMTLPTAATSSSSGTLKATISRSTSNQYINIPTGYNTAAGYYLISATPNGVATSPTSISATGATVSTGTNALTFTKTVSVTPRVTTAGYVSAGTAGNSSVSLTASITTKAAATYTPTTSNQTISANQYLTGAQTIKGDANLLAKNIKKGITIFNVAGDYSGPEDDMTDAVRFFDYDGTVLYQYSKAQFLALSSMPANPSHTGLVAQGWNWTLADAKAHVTSWGFLDIGQMYTTSSGATELKIVLYQGRQAPYLMLAVNGTVSIDWGDGSTASSVTGTSLTTRIATQHTYANPGSYTIKISITSGAFSLYTGSTNYYGILNSNSTPNTNANRIYSVALEAVHIGNGDVTIGNYAFHQNYALDYITIPKTAKIGSSNNFTNCYRLRTITFPLGDNTFNYAFTFDGCYNLSFIGFSNKMTGNVNSSTFLQNCYNLDAIILPATMTSSYLPHSTILPQILRIIIPSQNLKRIQTTIDITSQLNSGTSIASSQFADNLWLNREINIPSNITSIGSYAFRNCKSIRKITVAANNANIYQNDYLFNSCFALQFITIPTAITSVRSYTFDELYSLLGPITFPSSLTSISGGDCFEHAYSLRSLSLPNTITSLGAYFCNACYNLINFTFPTSLTSIGGYSFQNCYRWTNITIPSGVTSIGNSCFTNCYGLKEIHMLPTTPPTLGGTSVFTNLLDDCVIYVPSASLSAYQSATNWSTFASRMVGV